MIVVDTTVWIDFFRAKDTEQTVKLRRLIGRELILIGDIVLVEILQGAFVTMLRRTVWSER